MKINKIVAVFVTTAFALSIAKPVFAEETNQEQKLEQKCEVVCEVGAYGQDTTCTNQCYQYGKQIQTITGSSQINGVKKRSKVGMLEPFF